jgi:hypothetical protein
MDPLLLRFLQLEDEKESQRELERLILDAEPEIAKIVRRRLQVSPGLSRSGANLQDLQSLEDLQSNARRDVIRRLRQLKSDPAAERVANFHGFVNVTTHHVCDAYIREKYPPRAALKKNLHYLLTGRTNQGGLTLWDGTQGERLCGFAKWRDLRKPLARSSRYEQLREDPQRFAREALPGEDPARMKLADLVAAIFNWIGGPIELDDLVAAAAVLQGVAGGPILPLPDPMPDPHPGPPVIVEHRAFLRQLWAEVQQLPPRQAAAVLLNLKDAGGHGVIELFPLLRIAGPRQIAVAIDLAPEQLAALWNELPIDDATIAGILTCTRQQVINLRKVARERLDRRMKSFAVEG